jgi:D-alanyl-D-alanine carboxypeptidase
MRIVGLLLALALTAHSHTPGGRQTTANRGPAATSIPPSELARVVTDLQAVISERAAAGAFSGAVLVARLDGHGGVPVFESYAGMADRAANRPITVETTFITASTAKAFVGAAILRLAAQGRIALDAPLVRYLDATAYARQRGSVITIAQLLHHTAGLGDVVVGQAFRSSPQSLTTFDQLLALVRADPPVGEPGRFKYGDDDYILLGGVIRAVTGDFNEGMRDAVFVAADMGHTTYALATSRPRLAHGYTTRDIEGPAYASGATVLRANDSILPAIGVPGATAVTSARDLMHFADAIVHARLGFDPRQIWNAAVSTGQSADNPANGEYGAGFFVGAAGPHRIINHGGTGPGIDNAFDVYPDLGVAVIVLSNLDPPAAQDIRSLLRQRVGALPR